MQINPDQILQVKQETMSTNVILTVIRHDLRAFSPKTDNSLTIKNNNKKGEIEC